MNVIENYMYSGNVKDIEDMIAVTSRVNNKKRNYLLLNKLQAKYIPINANRALEMFDCLSAQVAGVEGKIIVVGFAETATAIGARLAYKLSIKKDNFVTVCTTTREKRSCTPICEFKEEHSHAVEQILYGDSRIFEEADWIVFAEDEVTTGNTIRNCVACLKEKYDCKYAVASILNCMSEKEMKQFHKEGIEAFWLIKTDKDGLDRKEPAKKETLINFPFRDIRLGVHPVVYEADCESLAVIVKENLQRIYDLSCEERDILVLGTEECMYPAIKCAEYLGKQFQNTVVSASTRVPTSVEGPITNRNVVPSVYGDRDTYLYNLGHYDIAVIITDGYERPDGIVNTLWQRYGVGNILVAMLRNIEK